MNFAVFGYLGAITLANLSLLWFGPSAAIVNAFLLIGLDLTLRDRIESFQAPCRFERPRYQQISLFAS